MKALPLSLKTFLEPYNGVKVNCYVTYYIKIYILNLIMIYYDLISKIKRLVNNMFTSLFGGATQI